MAKPSLIMIGAGGHTRSCIDVIEAEGSFKIAGLVGKSEELHQKYCGYEVIATDADLPRLAVEYQNALISVGQINSSESRERLYQMARNAGFALPVIVSPYARVSTHAQIGEGSIIMFGAMVNTRASVGANCIINSGALVEHDARVGDHCHISTGAILNGNVTVGASCFIGSGTVTKHGVSIGNHCLVGMASVIRHDLPDGTTFSTGAPHD